MSLNRYTFMSIVCCLVAVACNYTEPGTCSLGQGGSGPVVGQGGGVILPPQGGLGDDVDPQGAGDQSDPCNKVDVPKVKRDLYCNGDVVCWNLDGPGATGCHHENTHVKALDSNAAVDELVKECQIEYPDYDCEPEKLSCADLPKAQTGKVPIYVCNGGVPCKDSNMFMESCNYTARVVYAWDAPEAQEFLREECETVLAEKYGDTCEWGGFCCEIGSLTCNKKLTPTPAP